MSRISSDAILDKLQNRLSGLVLPTVPCILGPFNVHHELCDLGVSTNILPKMVYDCLDEDPLVPASQQLQLADSTMVQPYGIAEIVLIEFQDSSTLVDFMIMDMDPRQQTSIIMGKPFLKSVRATIDKTRETINMNVDGVHVKFIYHPKNLTCCCQIRVHRYPGSRKVRCMEVIPEHMTSRPQPRNKGPKKDAMTPDNEPSAAENFSAKSTRCVKDATSVVFSSRTGNLNLQI
jgi:hypothetical protein